MRRGRYDLRCALDWGVPRDVLAETLGVTERTVFRRMKEGRGLDRFEADRLATALHVWPTEIWEGWR